MPLHNMVGRGYRGPIARRGVPAGTCNLLRAGRFVLGARGEHEANGEARESRNPYSLGGGHDLSAARTSFIYDQSPAKARDGRHRTVLEDAEDFRHAGPSPATVPPGWRRYRTRLFTTNHTFAGRSASRRMYHGNQ
jgi:hypothetical protein